MRQVSPKVFVIAETQLKHEGYFDFLTHIGAEGWRSTYPSSDAEELVEAAGHTCYKAFGTELNANLSRVREGNQAYISNIIKQEHGSVLEHATTTVAMCDVSRILTHEYVRHRAGTAFSQESMRFVRMDDIPIWIPNLESSFKELAPFVDGEADKDHNLFAEQVQLEFEYAFSEITKLAEFRIKQVASWLDRPGVPFSLKKKITSALRRLAPSGHATNIIGTGNHRAWRFEIQQRTAAGAEYEIRSVFAMIAEDFKERYPAFYQDMEVAGFEDDLPIYKFTHHKI